MNDTHLENRLTDALDATTDAMAASTPPAFTWQSEDLAAHPAVRRTPRRARYAATGLVAAAVATVVAVAVAGAAHQSTSHRSADGSTTPARSQPVRTGTPATGPEQNAPRLLLAAAHTRLQTGDPTLADGQYRYIRITGPGASHLSGDKVEPAPAGSYSLDEYWIPKDQTQLWMRRSSTPGDPDGGGTTTWKGRCGDLYADAQDGPKGPACTRPGTFDDPTPAFVAALPRDPAALYDQLHTYAAARLNPDKIHDVGYQMFFTVDSLLSSGILTGDITSTFYGVLSRIPGIQVIDGATNYAGVAGTGFRLSTTFGHGADASPTTSTIIVDLGDGAYLGDRTEGDGLHQSSAVSVAVADHLGQPAR